MNRLSINILLIPLILSLLLIVLRFNFNYLVFHAFAELFAVFVSFGITLVTYYTYSFTKNKYLLFIGLGYFWIAILDMLHTQTYPGMPLYSLSSSNPTLTFWVFARVFEASILLIAPFMRKSEFSVVKVTFFFAFISFNILMLAMYFPLDLFVVGEGLTTLKISFEYFVITLLLLAIYINKVYKDEFNKDINYAVTISIVLTILSEISFTLYTDMYGIMNLVGHVLKFISFWILLHIIIKTSLSKPLALMQKGASTYDVIPIPSIVVDNYGTVRQVNQAACDFAGISESEIISKSNHKIFHPSNMLEKDCPICKAIKENNFIKDYELKGATGRCVEFSLSPIKSHEDEVRGVVQVSIDTTQKKELQHNLSNQYKLLNNIINSVPIRIFWKDVDGNYLGANNLFLQDAKLDSIDQLIGKNDFDMVWAETQGQLYRDDDFKIISTGVAKLQFEEEQTDDRGKTIILSTSKVAYKNIDGTVIGLLGIYEDVTYKKDMENKLLQQSKMAQMGEMISMIAHQWRQPLGAISATAINLQMKLELDLFDMNTKEGVAESREYFLDNLGNINHFVDTLTTTIDDFRNFYKANKESTSTKLQTVIEKSLKVISVSLVNDNIKIIKDYEDNEEIRIYDNEMMQVILNILKNSQDNFKDKKIKEAYIKIHTTNKTIVICDNGGGVPVDSIDRIFEPYFSTKDEKNGTGLGLYMSKTIIEEHHGGELSVENTEDGVCFKIKLN